MDRHCKCVCYKLIPKQLIRIWTYTSNNNNNNNNITINYNQYVFINTFFLTLDWRDTNVHL